MKIEPSTVSGSEIMKKTTNRVQQKSPDGRIPTRLMMNEDTGDTENSMSNDSVDRTFSTLVRELENK